MKLDEKLEEKQIELEALVDFVGSELHEIAKETGANEELVLLDFIGNLIDRYNSAILGEMLCAECMIGEMTKEEALDIIRDANIRPRYKKRVKELIEKMLGDEDGKDTGNR